MARIRTIKPEFPHSESMGRISREARLLMLQLFTIVDDAGRTRAASRLLASLLYPYDDDAPGLMDGWLDELERERCIKLYEVDGTQYMEVCNWLKHQKIDHPSKSKFPGPDGDFANPREDVASPRASRARGLDLGPRTKDLDQERTRSTREGSREQPTVRSVGKGRIDDDWPPDHREQFEAAYPHKVGMKAALDALDQARGKVAWRIVMQALATYTQTKPTDRHWMNPQKWITEERWNDQPAPASAGNGKHHESPGDRARRLAREVEAAERQVAPRGSHDAVGGAELGGDDARLVARGRSE